MTIPAIRERIHDIAGIRITCSFVSDAYWIADMLSRQPDLTVLKVKDYIDHPKPNGYRSLHLIVEVPVFLSEHRSEERRVGKECGERRSQSSRKKKQMIEVEGGRGRVGRDVITHTNNTETI